MKSIRPVSNYGFNNQDFAWNVLPEVGIPGLWLLPENLEEMRLTSEANKSPLEKWPGTLFSCVVHRSISGEGTKVAFLKDGKEEH